MSKSTSSRMKNNEQYRSFAIKFIAENPDLKEKKHIVDHLFYNEATGGLRRVTLLDEMGRYLKAGLDQEDLLFIVFGLYKDKKNGLMDDPFCWLYNSKPSVTDKIKKLRLLRRDSLIRTPRENRGEIISQKTIEKFRDLESKLLVDFDLNHNERYLYTKKLKDYFTEQCSWHFQTKSKMKQKGIEDLPLSHKQYNCPYS